MKIIDIRVEHLEYELNPPFAAAWDPTPRDRFAATLVYVDTDEGITGVGSGDTMDGFDAFRHLFLGEDPMAIARHVLTLETITYHAARYWPLEAALWDVIGKVCGQPVAQLFGGARDRIPAYASCGELKSPEARVESALALRAEGFKALKIRIDRSQAAEGMAAVRAVREAVGDSMEIMVDMNQAWRMAGDTEVATDLPAARRMAEALRELDVLWMEEPLPETQLDDLVELRRAGGCGAGCSRRYP